MKQISQGRFRFLGGAPCVTITCDEIPSYRHRKVWVHIAEIAEAETRASLRRRKPRTTDCTRQHKEWNTFSPWDFRSLSPYPLDYTPGLRNSENAHKVSPSPFMAYVAPFTCVSACYHFNCPRLTTAPGVSLRAGNALNYLVNSLAH